MAGTPIKYGPMAVTTAVMNVANPVANTYVLIRHIHVANTNAATRAFSAWVDVTAGSGAGKALVELKVIAANDVFDMYFPAGLRLVAADFLTASAGTDSTSLEISVSGEAYAL